MTPKWPACRSADKNESVESAKGCGYDCAEAVKSGCLVIDKTSPHFPTFSSSTGANHNLFHKNTWRTAIKVLIFSMSFSFK